MLARLASPVWVTPRQGRWGGGGPPRWQRWHGPHERRVVGAFSGARAGRGALYSGPLVCGAGPAVILVSIHGSVVPTGGCWETGRHSVVLQQGVDSKLAAGWTAWRPKTCMAPSTVKRTHLHNPLPTSDMYFTYLSTTGHWLPVVSSMFAGNYLKHAKLQARSLKVN